MMNQNQITPHYPQLQQNPSFGSRQNIPPQPQQPQIPLSYFEGWRQIIRPIAFIHLLFAALTLFISLILMIVDGNDSKSTFEYKAFSHINNTIIHILELLAAIMLVRGTGKDNVAQDPVNCMKLSIVWLTLCIAIWTGIYFNGHAIILLLVTPINTVVSVIYSIKVIYLLVFFGLVVVYTMAIHEEAKQRRPPNRNPPTVPQPQPSWQTVAPGNVNMNPAFGPPMGGPPPPD